MRQQDLNQASPVLVSVRDIALLAMSAECELSVDHITITLAIQWRRLGAGVQRLASAGPQLQHERGGAYWRTKALQTSRLSPNSHLFLNRAKSMNGELDGSGRP